MICSAIDQYLQGFCWAESGMTDSSNQQCPHRNQHADAPIDESPAQNAS